MGLFTLLFALGETISETIKENRKNRIALEEQLRYEDIDWNNIEYVTFDYTETAYRIETEEEFDIVKSNFLSDMDGWPHYETETVEYEVEDGENYCFTIRYKNGTEIYRKFHEDSWHAKRLLEYCNNKNSDKMLGRVFDVIDSLDKTVTNLEKIVDSQLEDVGVKISEKSPKEEPPVPKERFVVIDFETTGLNYDFHNFWHDEIISVAIIDQDGNTVLNTLCDTVKKKSWYEAQQIHGISPRDVKGHPTFVEIMPNVIKILSSYDYVISYNVPFEKTFLENYAHFYAPRDFLIFNVKWGRDPMQMFMSYMNSKSFLKLETAAKHFGYTYKAHNALEDAKAALHVYKNLRKINH